MYDDRNNPCDGDGDGEDPEQDPGARASVQSPGRPPDGPVLPTGNLQCGVPGERHLDRVAATVRDNGDGGRARDPRR